MQHQKINKAYNACIHEPIVRVSSMAIFVGQKLLKTIIPEDGVQVILSFHFLLNTLNFKSVIFAFFLLKNFKP